MEASVAAVNGVKLAGMLVVTLETVRLPQICKRGIKMLKLGFVERYKKRIRLENRMWDEQ